MASGKGHQPDGRASILRWIAGVALALLLVALGLAAGAYYAGRAGTVSLRAQSAASRQAGSAKAPPAHEVMHDLALNSFVVNLADAGGHSYARIGLTLRLASQETKKQPGTDDSNAEEGNLRDMVRDRIISVLNSEHSMDLLASDGKERLKQAIAAAIVARDPNVRIVDIYFTEFLVQT